MIMERRKKQGSKRGGSYKFWQNLLFQWINNNMEEPREYDFTAKYTDEYTKASESRVSADSLETPATSNMVAFTKR